jgi:hypothetical protein
MSPKDVLEAARMVALQIPSYQVVLWSRYPQSLRFSWRKNEMGLMTGGIRQWCGSVLLDSFPSPEKPNGLGQRFSTMTVERKEQFMVAMLASLLLGSVEQCRWFANCSRLAQVPSEIRLPSILQGKKRWLEAVSKSIGECDSLLSDGLFE